MTNKSQIDDFDTWYLRLIEILAKDGKRAPYKMAWMDLYEQGASPEEAALSGPWVLSD